MPDREKVIKGLELCSNILGCINTTNTDCPYALGEGACRYQDLLTDALALLREQETTWVKEEDRTNHYHCEMCGYVTGIIARMHKFCPECGRKVMWE